MLQAMCGSMAPKETSMVLIPQLIISAMKRSTGLLSGSPHLSTLSWAAAAAVVASVVSWPYVLDQRTIRSIVRFLPYGNAEGVGGGILWERVDSASSVSLAWARLSVDTRSKEALFHFNQSVKFFLSSVAKEAFSVRFLSILFVLWTLPWEVSYFCTSGDPFSFLCPQWKMRREILHALVMIPPPFFCPRWKTQREMLHSLVMIPPPFFVLSEKYKGKYCIR